MEQLRSLFGSFSPLGYRGSRADGHDLGTLAGDFGEDEAQNGLLKRGFLGDQKLPSYMGIIDYIISHEIRIPSLNNLGSMELTRLLITAHLGKIDAICSLSKPQ